MWGMFTHSESVRIPGRLHSLSPRILWSAYKRRVLIHRQSAGIPRYAALHEDSHSLTLVIKCSPEGDGPHPAVVQYWGNPWKGRSKLRSTFREKKIDVISSGQCPRTRYYTGKNSYFYLILAYRPRSDTTGFFCTLFIPRDCSNSCGVCRNS